MNRKAVSGLVLTLLLTVMLMFILHPIHATPTTLTNETPIDSKDLLKLGSTSHTPEWNKTYGGPSYDYGYSLVQCDDGGYAVAGHTYSFGAGSWDCWLVKVDVSGNVEWNQTYGGTSDDLARSVVETGDGGYVIAGYTSSFGAGSADFWLIKLVGPPLPETIDRLKTKVEELGSQGEIVNQGIVTSLIAKLNVAQKLFDEGKIDQAKNILNAFINEVEAQSGKHITPDAADVLIESAEYILTNL
ncbi:MAG: hypothetical protein E3J73_07285 [Candidatus Bathyarchaeum sp.]|nr:MAG: hypothetical protein E3J73_07285 [Candidatus Bathyarchaeum sp.]